MLLFWKIDRALLGVFLKILGVFPKVLPPPLWMDTFRVSFKLSWLPLNLADSFIILSKCPTLTFERFIIVFSSFYGVLGVRTCSSILILEVWISGANSLNGFFSISSIYTNSGLPAATFTEPCLFSEVSGVLGSSTLKISFPLITEPPIFDANGFAVYSGSIFFLGTLNSNCFPMKSRSRLISLMTPIQC